MNILGYETAFSFGNVMGTIQTGLMWFFIGAGLIGLGIWFFMAAKNKATYKYPITLRVRRDNGLKVRYDILGGIVEGRNGVKDFKCKIPKKFKKFNLGYMPDFSLADSNDRLSFIQEGDSTSWQQVREELITEKVVVDDQGTEIGVYKLLIEPIPTDTKTTTYNNLQSTRELMDIKKMTAWGISIVAFICMLVAHLISLYIQTKIRCPTPA
jgi:hypothetical protein